MGANERVLTPPFASNALGSGVPPLAVWESRWKERRVRFGLQSIGLGVAVAVAAAMFAVGASAATSGGTKLSVHKTVYGKVLVGPGGLVVYMYGPDRRSKSKCYRTCAKFWHPLLTKGRPLAGQGVKAAGIASKRFLRGSPLVRSGREPR